MLTEHPWAIQDIVHTKHNAIYPFLSKGNLNHSMQQSTVPTLLSTQRIDHTHPLTQHAGLAAKADGRSSSNVPAVGALCLQLKAP